MAKFGAAHGYKYQIGRINAVFNCHIFDTRPLLKQEGVRRPTQGNEKQMRVRGFPMAAGKKLQMRGAVQQSRWTFDEGANPYSVTRWISKSGE
jgi:hypothetical protein